LSEVGKADKKLKILEIVRKGSEEGEDAMCYM
jgi:hypothetical protein